MPTFVRPALLLSDSSVVEKLAAIHEQVGRGMIIVVDYIFIEILISFNECFFDLIAIFSLEEGALSIKVVCISNVWNNIKYREFCFGRVFECRNVIGMEVSDESSSSSNSSISRKSVDAGWPKSRVSFEYAKNTYD